MEKETQPFLLRFFLPSLAILFFVGYLGCGWLEREDILMEVRFIPDTFDARHKSACLEYTLAEEVYVSIAIYNSAGELVVQLVDNQYETKSKHIYKWDGDEKAEVTFSIKKSCS